MINHITSVHEGKKQHECNNCSAAFEILFDLEYHITSVHEGKKQHNCDICSANFENHTDYKNHIASVHEGKKTNIEDKMKKSSKVNNARKSLDFSLEESFESSHEHVVKFCACQIVTS